MDSDRSESDEDTIILYDLNDYDLVEDRRKRKTSEVCESDDSEEENHRKRRNVRKTPSQLLASAPRHLHARESLDNTVCSSTPYPSHLHHLTLAQGFNMTPKSNYSCRPTPQIKIKMFAEMINIVG